MHQWPLFPVHPYIAYFGLVHVCILISIDRCFEEARLLLVGVVGRWAAINRGGPTPSDWCTINTRKLLQICTYLLCRRRFLFCWNTVFNTSGLSPVRSFVVIVFAACVWPVYIFTASLSLDFRDAVQYLRFRRVLKYIRSFFGMSVVEILVHHILHTTYCTGYGLDCMDPDYDRNL